MRGVWVPVVIAVAAGCVSSAEHEAVVMERDLLKGRVDDLQRQLDGAVKDRDRAKAAGSTGSSSSYRTSKGARADEAKRVREALKIGTSGTITAVFHTKLGQITCALMPDLAPKTVENFVALSEGTKSWTDPNSGEKREDPLYSGTVFHRVINDFMIQGGDPLGSGRGGPGYRFEDEVDPGARFDRPGLLAMANSGSNTNGSQFFITDSAPAHLNMKHTIFGECPELDVVKAILAQPRAPGRDTSKPAEPVVLERVEITRNPS